MAKSVFEILHDKVDADAKAIAGALAAGHASDYSEYQYMVGRIRGLSSVKDHIDALNKTYMSDED
tara:strand:- start:176 stop:370 length:195 start_codon:yes stop_codon:yes gene_type:complete